MDSSGVDISGSLAVATPVKHKPFSTQPLQPRNLQRPISSLSSIGSYSLPDESSAVSYRPALAKPPAGHTGSSPMSLQQSPTTVLRGGIPFSPHRLPAPTAYFFESPQRRPRAHSNVEPDLVQRWPC
jgi:hypothetical protein